MEVQHVQQILVTMCHYGMAIMKHIVLCRRTNDAMHCLLNSPINSSRTKVGSYGSILECTHVGFPAAFSKIFHLLTFFIFIYCSYISVTVFADCYSSKVKNTAQIQKSCSLVFRKYSQYQEMCDRHFHYIYILSKSLNSINIYYHSNPEIVKILESGLN
jgi:hypothetical protein